MVTNNIRFVCGDRPLELDLAYVKQLDGFEAALKESMVDLVYIHESPSHEIHAHLLNIARDYTSRGNTRPLDVQYGTRSGNGPGTHVWQQCKRCDARFPITIPSSADQENGYECLHVLKKGDCERPHYAWISRDLTMTSVEHIYFWIRESETPGMGQKAIPICIQEQGSA